MSKGATKDKKKTFPSLLMVTDAAIRCFIWTWDDIRIRNEVSKWRMVISLL